MSRLRRSLEATSGLFKEHPVRLTLITGVLNIPGAAAAAILPQDASTSARVGLAVAAVLVGTAVVVIALLLWAFLTDPRRRLASEVRELGEKVDDLAEMVKPRPEVVRVALRLMRDEARDNRRSLQIVSDRGKFWRLTERAPTQKYWKRHRELISNQSEYQEVWDRGRAANDELERIMQARAVRAFLRWRRDVTSEDRLPEAIRAFDAWDEALTAEIDRLERR
jgi:hypothetical protein